MAQVGFVGAGTGVEDTAGAYSASKTGCTVGNLIIVQVNVDAATVDGTQTLGTCSGVESLGGTADTMDQSAEFQIGVNASRHILWFGRATGTTVTFNATTAGQDVYVRVYEFSNADPNALTIADLVENGTAGTINNETGNGVTVPDCGVTTLGTERLAVNFIGINDDNAVLEFTGETGGNWSLGGSFTAAAGTDAAIGMNYAEMASAGTINGGTYTQVTDPWGVIGFAIKPESAAPPAGGEPQIVNKIKLMGPP